MQQNNNLSPIPFYRSIEEQDFRKWYAYGEKFPHRVPGDYLVPFYFVTPNHLQSDLWRIDGVTFYSVCTCGESEYIHEGERTPYESMQNNNFTLRYIGGISEVVYYASHNSPIDLPSGFFYMKVTMVNKNAVTEEYFSDVFFVGSRASIESQCTHIEWWNDSNIEYEGGAVPYGEVYNAAYYKSEVFVDAEIGKPTYTLTEEGEERDGYFFPTKQLSEKVYNLSFLAPEFLCDILRLVPLADVMRVTDRLGRVYNAEQFNFEFDWTEQGHYAEAVGNFHTDTVVKKIGKVYNLINDR